MNSFLESLTYLIVKFLGAVITRLPISVALAFGRLIGVAGYYISVKHKSIVYSNLKIAFARTKKPSEIKRIVKQLFRNYGQNIIELFRLPQIYRAGCEKFVKVEGKEHVHEALKKQKGVILLAMHCGSWEISSLMGEILKHPYKVVAKPQDKHSRLDSLLNSYRECAGTSVITRGRGTRELIESLRRNEVVGMVVDQGGKDGALVKFFGRLASMSVGAIRLGLKLDVPICFSIIVREKGPNHRLTIHSPLELVKTGDVEKDVITNLNSIVRLMEQYITKYPSEYMWFYKIWKYSKEATTVILHEGKAGHLHQSMAVNTAIEEALGERGIESKTEIVEVEFKNKLAQKILAVFSAILPSRFSQGRLRYLKWFLTKKSFLDIAHMKADFVISCGSSVAGVNFLLSRDYRAKSICILKPGILRFNRFDLVVLPHHDRPSRLSQNERIVFVQGAVSLINASYLEEQSKLLAQRFSYLKEKKKMRIGVLLGGDSKRLFLTEQQVKITLSQVAQACEQIDGEILVTTSRRTPGAIESLLQREAKEYSKFKLVVIANRNNVPEAMGGILGLADIIVASGDSISMVAEAASSGKNVIVFAPEKRKNYVATRDKHEIFIEKMNTDGYIFLSSEKNISQTICAMAKNKIKTKKLDNNQIILEAAKGVI